MYTRCPECSTCFRVTERHLAIAKGKVRCGHCQLVFNATENAIDDLPVSQLTSKPASPKATVQSKQAEVIKSKASAKEEKITPAAKTEKVKPEKTKEKLTPAPEFKADATMIADIGNLDSDEMESINLDSVSEQASEMDDDIFDDSFDLNAAIDELTQATENKNTDNPFLQTSADKIKVKPDIEVKDEAEKYIPDQDNNSDVFDTDAYNATSAASVADIFNEMEGQMSLDINTPEEKNDNDNEDYDINSEFDFIQLDDDSEEDKTPATADNTEIADEFEIFEPETVGEQIKDVDDDKFDDDDDLDFELEETTSENKPEKAAAINEEALFDQVDLSDFNNSDVAEKIVIEDTNQESFSDLSIGKHSDDYEVPLHLRDELENLDTPSRRLFSPAVTIPLTIFLLLVSFSQLTYFRAHEIVNMMPSARPLLESFCETIGCYYSGPRDTKQIELISRDVRLHPKEKNALLISAAMINNAYFAQPYPDIHIRLSDISGNVVAERVFNAKTYMGKISNPFLLMKSKTPVHINFEVIDPGRDAINFEFTFL